MPSFQRKVHRTRRVMDAVAHAYPAAWQQIDDFRRQRGEPGFDWPDWCYMPIGAGYAIVSGGGHNRVPLTRVEHPAIVTALATWRMTQGIYRFDPALIAALAETPMDGDIPAEHLQRLPEWCVYVELSGAGIPYCHGAWLHMESDMARGGAEEFRIVFDTARDPRQPFAPDGLKILALPLAGSIDESLDCLARSALYQASSAGLPMAPEAGDAIRSLHDLVRRVLSVALYLCADADITRRGVAARPANPSPVRSGSGRWSLHPAAGPTEWDVGLRIGAALRDAYQREQSGGDAAPSGRSVRPHVRRAHWHTVLSGARKREDGSEVPTAERERNLRWMPPIPVNVDDVDALPSVIRPVK